MSGARGGAAGERGEAAPSVEFLCPSCGGFWRQKLGGDRGQGALRCPGCRERFGEAGKGLCSGEIPKVCPLCGGEEFYTQRDFNRQVGFRLAIAGLLGVFLVMLLVGHRAGIACLVAFSLLDAFFWIYRPPVVVCYLCQSVYRGLRIPPAPPRFDLAREEQYKKRRTAWVERWRSR